MARRQVPLSLDDELLKRIDALRGKVPRQTWIERVLDVVATPDTASPVVPVRTSTPRASRPVDPEALKRQQRLNADRDRRRSK